MDPSWLIMMLAVTGAATLQAATGIGFGVIAGPVMLLVLGSGAAIQLSIALSFLIALVLAPTLRGHLDRGLLLHLLAGSLLGLPVGILVFLSIGIDLLKLLAALAVLLTLFVVLVRRAVPGASRAGIEPRRGRGRLEQIGMGVISGVMSGSLAMPGPVPAAWMAARDYNKDTVRSTILTLFLFSYLAAFALQIGLAGVGRETLIQGAVLTPGTLLGIVLGRVLAARFSEHLFRRVLLAVLAATALGLFADSLPALVSP